ncbi:N-6 DNA methylase [Streptomyces sp. NPDC055955]|uniref:class I SAM-dependent DNA methyltransferase n=1 Tax=Streptomyces sp. NPDC055955 TaxID=3345665 RepID=UPI0035DC017D
MTNTPDAHRGSTAEELTNRLWEYCGLLRDRGLATIEYAEQLTYLLLLKMADEQSRQLERRALAFGEPEAAHLVVPPECGWESLTRLRGKALRDGHRQALAHLSAQDRGTTFETVFADAKSRIHDAGLLEKLIADLIRPVEWTSLQPDVLGSAYEFLLEKGTNEVRSGAGQFFTPRPLVDAIVTVIQPQLADTVTDPACGTGGFLIAAHQYLQKHIPGGPYGRRGHDLGPGRIWGQELVPRTAGLAAMNLLLHGLGSIDGPSLVTVGDALAEPPSRRASLVLSHPPFGTRQALPHAGTPLADGRYRRADFPFPTANKQINFLQHIMSVMDAPGRGAVILPDNVLFEPNAEPVRHHLLHEFDFHTLLRLPTGIFFAGGVKANVLFFEKDRQSAAAGPRTSQLWVYDLRSGSRFSPGRNPLQRTHLDDFVQAYLPGRPRTERRDTERFRAFGVDELLQRDHLNLDLWWGHDPSEDPGSLLPPEQIAQDIVADLQAALGEFEALASAVRKG